jgi:hypothetical protein
MYTMTAYSGQTQTTLGQLCSTLWNSQWQPVVIQPEIKPGSVVTPLALRCITLHHCATQEPKTTPSFLNWCFIFIAHELKCAARFSHCALDPKVSTSVLSWFSWRKLWAILVYTQSNNLSIELKSSGDKNVKVCIICVAVKINDVLSGNAAKE